MQDFSSRIAQLRSELAEASEYLRIDELRARRPQLEAELGRPDLWDDAEAAQALQREFAELTDDLELYDGLAARIEDVATLHELAREEGDESLEPEIESELDDLEREFAQLELRALFTGDLSRALCSGGKLVLAPREWLLDPERLYALMRAVNMRFLRLPKPQVKIGEALPEHYR